MKFCTSLYFSLAAIGVGNVDSASSLRSGSSESFIVKESAIHQRRLFNFVTIDQIIQAFVPALNLAIQSSLSSNLENVDLGMGFTQQLADLQLGPNCTSSASVAYGLETLTGLAGFQIDSVELVPGTGSLNIPFFGLNGASWSGTWNVRGSFPSDIVAASTATLTGDACGLPIEETSSGTIAAKNPGFELIMDIDGSTPSVFNLGTSVVDSITIEDARITFDSIAANIDGLFGNNLQLDLSTIFDGLFTSTIIDSLLPLIIELLQSALGGGLPF